MMTKCEDIVLKNQAEGIVARCRAAKNGSIVERFVVCAEAMKFIADVQASRLEKQLIALAVTTKDRAERNSNG